MFNRNSEFLDTSRPTKKEFAYEQDLWDIRKHISVRKCYPQPFAFLPSSFYFFCLPKLQDGNQSLGLMVTGPSLYDMVSFKKNTLNFVLFSILALPAMSKDSRTSGHVAMV